MTSTDFPGSARGRGDTITVEEYAIPMDAIYPRDAVHRFRLYARVGKDLTVLAATDSAGGIGEAIMQIHADQKEAGERLADLGQIGVLDAVEREWIVLPFPRSGAAVHASE